MNESWDGVGWKEPIPFWPSKLLSSWNNTVKMPYTEYNTPENYQNLNWQHVFKAYLFMGCLQKSQYSCSNVRGNSFRVTATSKHKSQTKMYLFKFALIITTQAWLLPNHVQIEKPEFTGNRRGIIQGTSNCASWAVRHNFNLIPVRYLDSTEA